MRITYESPHLSIHYTDLSSLSSHIYTLRMDIGRKLRVKVQVKPVTIQIKLPLVTLVLLGRGCSLTFFP